MIVSFGMGVMSHAYITEKNDTIFFAIPEAPIPLALQYNHFNSQNEYDFMPAQITTGGEEGDTEVLGASLSVTEKNFVAAKSGTKYYPAGCGSIDRIKPENRVYFNTAKEAEDRGYSRTETCKDL